MALVITLGILLAACNPAAQTTPSQTVEKPSAAPGGAASGSTASSKWDSTVAEGKKEGTVAIYSLWGPQVRQELTRGFKDKYGITLEFSPFNRGSDLLAKVQAEKRAGLNIVDVFGAGNSTLIVNMKSEGVLGPVEPLLVLPDVRDPNTWFGGKLPYTDKDGLAFSMLGGAWKNVVYNTQLIKDGEITGYKDLLKPQYKGKITLSDPTMSGSSNSLLSHMSFNLWSEAEATDFLKRLITEQDVAIQRDNRLHVETVARGKYAICLAPFNDPLTEFISVGAPLKAAPLKEDNLITAGMAGLGVPTKLAHPNATVVFVNWLLGKEGQSILAKNNGKPSRRLDASTEGIDPIYIPVPGEKYFMESEEWFVVQGKWLDLAKKIMQENVK